MKAISFRIGSNMFDKPDALYTRDIEDGAYHEKVYFEKDAFHKMTEEAKSFGFDTLVLELAEGIMYESHPELAIEGSMPRDEFKAELDRLKGMGFGLIPLVDFSPAKNAWMQGLGYVGTKRYENACEDILREVIELFEKPEYVQLGFEDESFSAQEDNAVINKRHFEKRIADANRLFDICREYGVKPWIWMSEKILESYGGEEEFRAGIPTDVTVTSLAFKRVQEYHIKEKRADKSMMLVKDLAEWGYPQIPMASTWLYHAVPNQAFSFYTKHCDGSKFAGFLCHPCIFSVERKYYWLMNDMYRFNKAYEEHIK